MAIIVKTTEPLELLKAIKKAIDNHEVNTWKYNNDGDFTHTSYSKQWHEKAWLIPKSYLTKKQLRFGIITPKNKKLDRNIYGVYQGRFIEMLLTHFYKYFTTVYATSLKTAPDVSDILE